jgi:DNA-binding response OmpR family regulator
MAKILIVEDDADLVETYTDLFEAHGHSVSCAADIREAIDRLFEMQPEIITLDLHLPGNSNSAIAILVHTAKQINQSKIIIITGHPERMPGIDDNKQIDLILTKPVDNAHLLAMIDRLVAP